VIRRADVFERPRGDRREQRRPRAGISLETARAPAELVSAENLHQQRAYVRRSRRTPDDLVDREPCSRSFSTIAGCRTTIDSSRACKDGRARSGRVTEDPPVRSASARIDGFRSTVERDQAVSPATEPRRGLLEFRRTSTASPSR